MVRTPAFRFVRPLVGFETFEAGELIATDGEDEIRAPEHCAVLMPARVPIVGRVRCGSVGSSHTACVACGLDELMEAAHALLA